MEEQTEPPFAEPCPFCGLALRWMTNQDDYIVKRYGPRYEHPDPSGCFFAGLEVTVDEIKTWNRRPLPAPSAPVPQEGEPQPVRVSKLPIDPTLAMMRERDLLEAEIAAAGGIEAWRAAAPAAVAVEPAAQPEPIAWASYWRGDNGSAVLSLAPIPTPSYGLIRQVALYAHPPAAGASEAHKVLAELLALKDLKASIEPPNFEVSAIKRRLFLDDYERRMPIAWANARRVLGETK